MGLPQPASNTARLETIPRSDGWVWLSIAFVSASLLWTAFVVMFSLTSERCTPTRDQCVLAFAASFMWTIPQLLFAVPHFAALITLTRYAGRGNHGLPAIGLALFAANCAMSVALMWYLSTLPSYFR